MHILEGPIKRPKTSDQLFRGQQGQSQYNTCGKLHDGVCHSKGLGCYKCGRFGLVIKDCPQGASPLYVHYDQVGHKKADCSTLRGGAVSVPASTFLRITDG